MLSTKLTTTDQQILSNASIPTILRSLIERRTNNKRIFGRLEINVPDVAATAGGDIISKIIAGFLLDTSGSMQGTKLKNAINTIKQFAEILLSERDGKTVASQPIKSWIYVITFNSDAELAIPFQEITAESLPNIFTQLDQIRTSGCTNYERAFKKQTEVIADIIRGLRREVNPPTADDDATPYHLIRFFETDGEITEGMRSQEILYKMMRDTGDTTDSDTDSDATTATTVVSPLTFEDYILGYGTDVDLNCLQTLASPYQRSEYLLNRSHANRKPQYTDAYNCSSLITIVKPEDIGWQVGELLFKVIMRYGYKVQVSVATTDADGGRTTPLFELFEYQSHQWSNTTTLHSMIHGEKKVLYIQYTPPPIDASDAASDAPPVIGVGKIQYSNQFTGSTYTYEFEHAITPASVPDLPSIAADTIASVPDLPVSIILGMIQIEIFKQFREIEPNNHNHREGNAAVRYDKDTIVREAYKTIRMLKSLYQPIEITPHTPLIENLITDVKVIIGLTTINDAKEKTAILHARRIASGEQDIFNTGASVSRKYVENEEDYEDDATKVINAHRESSGDQHDQHDNDNGAHADAEDYADDGIPSRIPTVINTPYSQNQDNGQYQRGRSSSSCDSGSLLRTLCARIAMAKKRKEDLTIEQLYDQVKRYGSAAGNYPGHHDEFDLYGHADDTFSSTPMNDENTQRRMGMMRQMSSNSQPSA